MMKLVSQAAKSLKPRMADDPAQIEIEIGEALRAAEGARAEQARLLAAHDAELDDEAAEALLRQWRDQGRAVKRAEKAVDDLRERLEAAKRRRLEQFLAKHKRLIGAAARHNIEAQKAAAAANVAAIEAVEAARAELGKLVERVSVPQINFAGIPLPDLVDFWAKSISRSLAAFDHTELPPKPAQRSAEQVCVINASIAVAPHEPARMAQIGRMMPTKPAAAPVPVHGMTAPERPPRLDPPPSDESQRAVIFLRSGADIDGFQVQRGDRLTLPEPQARALVSNGAAEFVSDLADEAAE